MEACSFARWNRLAFQCLMGIYAGDGYCRSEAVVAVYLQKKESAKRIYATVVYSKSNSDGYKNIGIGLHYVSVRRWVIRTKYKFLHLLHVCYFIFNRYSLPVKCS